MCTKNYANLLAKCFLEQHPVPLMRVIKWNDKGGNGMILNVDGSNLGNPGVFDFEVCLGSRMVLGSMDLLKI